MVEEFNWSEFYGCLELREKFLITFIDTIRGFAFYVLADLVDTTANLISLNGVRYESFKRTYITGEFTIEDEEIVRFYEIDWRLFEGLRTYLNSGQDEKCLTVGIWNQI